MESVAVATIVAPTIPTYSPILVLFNHNHTNQTNTILHILRKYTHKIAKQITKIGKWVRVNRNNSHSIDMINNQG